MIEIPFGFLGRIYRSPMPFSKFDKSNQTWELFKQANINIVVVLTEEQEISNHTRRNLIASYLSEGFKVWHFPIQDYAVPVNVDSFSGLIDRVIQSLQVGDNIVIHCLAGEGRTGLFFACMAKKHFSHNAEDSINWVRNFIPTALENFDQEKFVYEF